jgi:small-conductance mechanosensitive channel
MLCWATALAAGVAVPSEAVFGQTAAVSAESKPPKPANSGASSSTSASSAALKPSDPTTVSTPRRSLSAFMRACETKDFVKAAEFLDLRALPRGKDAREGPELAALLYRIIVTRISVELEELPDEAAPSSIGTEGLILDRLDVDDSAHSIVLVPVKLATGETRWQFSRSTVASIRPVYEATQKRVVEEAVPAWLKQRTYVFLYLWQWLGLLLATGFSYLIGRVFGGLTTRLATRAISSVWSGAAVSVRSLARPARLALATAAFQLGLPFLLLPAQFAAFFERASSILYVIAAAWSAVLLVRVATQAWEERLPEDTQGQHANRGLLTRLTMVRRIATVVVTLIAAGVILLQFEIVRNVGLSLLASAGIAGVLVGIAAQRTLSGLIAGVELSITQPVRIGDTVVFRPGEVGTVEHVFFTYVVVRLWDDRRLIVPVARVMSEPFENWTRSGSDLLAPVDIYADHEVPVGELRAAFERLCKQSPLWDQRSSVVEVVEMNDRVLKIRGTASVDVASKAYALKCELREGWVSFLRELEGGRYLPLTRVRSLEEESEEPKSEEPKPVAR